MNQFPPVTALNLSSPYLPTAGTIPATPQPLSAAATTSPFASLTGVQPGGSTTLGVSINPTGFMGSPLTSPLPATTTSPGMATTSNPELNGLLASASTIATIPTTPASTVPGSAPAPLAGVNALATTNPQTAPALGTANALSPGLNNPELNNLIAGATAGVSAINQEVDDLLTQDYNAGVAAGKIKVSRADYLKSKKGVDATKPINVKDLIAQQMALQGTASSNSLVAQSLGSASAATVDSVVRRYQENGGNYAKAAEKVTPGALAALGLTAEQFKEKVMAVVAKNPPAADTATAPKASETTEKKEIKPATEKKDTKAATSTKTKADSTATTVKLKGTNQVVEVK
jgi:hypothetical protein